MPSASTRSAASHDAVGRWTHTFSRCPVSVAVRSEVKLSSIIKQNAGVPPTSRRQDASERQKREILRYENHPTRIYLPRT